MQNNDAKSTLTIVKGASYVKVSKVKKDKVQVVKEEKLEKNNKRGSVISKFSKEARRNMFYTIARIRRDCLPSFVTLTYPKVYSDDPNKWKNDLHIFVRRLARNFPDVAGIWKLEPQRRGAPHYHLLVWNVNTQDLCECVPRFWNDTVAFGDITHLRWHLGEIDNEPCVKEVTTQKGMYQYVTKYISKAAVENWKNVGKWWGVFGKERLPFGDEIVFEVTDQNADDIIRYMRRFTRYGGGMSLRSRQQVCDADFWMEKLQTKSMLTYKDWLRLPQVMEAFSIQGEKGVKHVY